MTPMEERRHISYGLMMSVHSGCKHMTFCVLAHNSTLTYVQGDNNIQLSTEFKIPETTKLSYSVFMSRARQIYVESSQSKRAQLKQKTVVAENVSAIGM